MLNPSRDSVITFVDASTTASYVSDYFPRGEFMLHSIQIICPGADVPVGINASNDGTNWVKVGNTITGNKMVILSGLYPYLQVYRDDTGTDEFTVTCVSGSKFRK